MLLVLALLSCAQSGPSASADDSGAAHTVAAETRAAAAALEAGRPWRATTILAPVLADPRRRTPDAILLGAKAAAGWSGWAEVDRLLRSESWIDTAFAGQGRALLARAAFERRDDLRATRDARAAIAAAPDGNERGARLVLLARTLERLDQRDSARVAYEAAATSLPMAADWLRLRAAALTRDTATRAGAYARLTTHAARARAPWVEAQARERGGDFVGAAARYESLGAKTTAVRVRLAGTSDPAAREAIRSQLLAIIERQPGSDGARTAVDIVAQAFALRPSEELGLARSAARGGPASRAAASFARAFASGVGTPEDRYSYGVALMQLGRNADAAQQFNLVRSGPLVADAAYQRARALVRTNRVDLAVAILERIVRSYPSSVEPASAALFLLGDLATDRGQDEHARALFRRVAHAYPTSTVAAAARFRAALIAFVVGDHRTAALELDTLIAKYPTSPDAQAAGYWSGRAWASVGDTVAAYARWRAVQGRDPLSYYALLATRRLGVDFVALPERTDTVAVPPDVTTALERARLLERLGLESEARNEYDWLATDADASIGRTLAVAAAFRACDLAPRAIQLARRALARGARADARTYRLLYPLAYEDLILAHAQTRQVDHALVAALIRQESNFEPRAVSRVGAAGLMQIMPEVGRKLATSNGFRSWKDPFLRQPEVNVQLGTAHLASVLRQYQDVSHALAAYNAGSGRVTRWLTKRGTEDPEVFVERIPFTETRDYVRIVLRNRAIYRALYGASPDVADGR